MFRQLLAGCALASIVALPLHAAGDLTRKPEGLPDLVLGNQQSDYALSQAEYQLETGKAYRLKVISSGLKEYAIEAPEFFAAIYLRKVEAGGMEIKANMLSQLEFEQEGEAEVYFVPIKPGNYRFYSKGLENKGMVGRFIVR